MTDARMWGPEAPAYTAEKDESGDLVVLLKDGTTATFDSQERAVLEYPALHRAQCRAVVRRFLGGTVKLVQLDIVPAAGEESIDPERVRRAGFQILKDAEAAFAAAEIERARSFAESATRKMAVPGLAPAVDDVLRAALVYSYALLRGLPHYNKLVADVFGCSLSTAKRRVEQARERGLLRPAEEIPSRAHTRDAADFPWVEPDDPQFVDDLQALVNEVEMIFAPRLFHFLRGVMFFEQLSNLANTGGHLESEEVKQAADDLFAAMGTAQADALKGDSIEKA